MLSNRRVRIVFGLLLIAALAWVGWRLSQSPSAQAQAVQGRLNTPAAPASRLQEDLQMAQAYLRQVLPRSGPYRYASADDYLWIETKDCAPALQGILQMTQAEYDPQRSQEHAVRYVALGLLSDHTTPEQAIQIAQRWPQSRELAWMAASQCNAILHCPQAAETAQRMAALDPDNLPAWLPLLQFAFYSAQPDLFRVALEGASDAKEYRDYVPSLRESLRADVAPLQPPAACALEFERRSLSHGVHYDADSWKASMFMGLEVNLANGDHIMWSDWCVPGELAQATPVDQTRCRDVVQRLEAKDMTLPAKPRLVRTLMRITEGTTEHAAWVEKARGLSWLNAFDMRQNLFDPQYDARGALIQARYRSDPKAGNARYELLERQARAKGAWTPPADFPLDTIYTQKAKEPGFTRVIQQRWRMQHSKIMGADGVLSQASQ